MFVSVLLVVDSLLLIVGYLLLVLGSVSVIIGSVFLFLRISIFKFCVPIISKLTFVEARSGTQEHYQAMPLFLFEPFIF